MISKWRYVLWPLALVNGLRIILRNRLFDLGIWKSIEFENPVIFVGSVASDPTIGCSAYISKLLHTALHINSRDLKGSGLLPTDNTSSLHFESYGNAILSTKHKALGLSEWYHYHSDTSAIVMDNEFGQNEIRPQLRVLVSDYDRPFYQDALWPVGHLNGNKSDLNAVDVVIIFATPEGANLKENRKKVVSFLNDSTDIFFIANSRENLRSFNLSDKIEFIQDRDNFERLIANVLLNATPNSE